MQNLYCLSKRFVLVIFPALVATQLLLIRNVSSLNGYCPYPTLNLTNAYLHHKCLVNQGKYKPGSQYEKNLNSHIKLLVNSDFRDGFGHVTTAMGTPNMVNIIFQCRGDSYQSKCRSCFSAGISELRKRCLRNKGGIIWFDQCFVEITAIEVMEVSYKNNFYMHNPNNVSGDAKSFNMETIAFLKQLMLEANRKDNMEGRMMALYAAGEKMIRTKKLYAMVQCTRDVFMFKTLCKECLERIISEYPKCCDGKRGGRVLGTSCNFRYELYPFLRT
ncbi:hypothetical protein CARUB_v10016100mg [Capsella rubella]|uniref:Gnk2-homologous domain-containing protein n=1 Tax=Capsella rubella TaxID=81985 RepID=R0I472_9BRAS|nr:putative cysteine-rich repeat secretory protein 31 [Capsella rubella]EOA32790.1 hypothetical protein CARUB_v10016100mg [Capsella rubella]